MNVRSFRWVVVLCAFTLMFVGFGAAYSFPMFFVAFEAEFGAARAHVSLVFALSASLYFVLGAPGGMLADRYGTRRVALVGVACLAAGLAAASFARSIEMLYVTYSIGLGIGIGLTYSPSVGAVQPWFDKQRVFATGLAVSGIGAGNLVAPPLVAWAITELGWRGAYLALSAVALVLGGAAAATIRKAPPAAAATYQGLSLGEAMRTRTFWMLYLATGLSGFGGFVPMVHLGRYAVDAGHPEVFGVLLVSLIGLGGLLGRLLVGAVADRLGRMRALALMQLMMAAMLLFWWASTGSVALSLMALGFGLAFGAYVATFPSVVMDLFGARSVAGIIGFIYTSAGIGTLFGPTLAGAAYDATGSYGSSILGAATLALLAAAITGSLPAAPRLLQRA